MIKRIIFLTLLQLVIKTEFEMVVLKDDHLQQKMMSMNWRLFYERALSLTFECNCAVVSFNDLSIDQLGGTVSKQQGSRVLYTKGESSRANILAKLSDGVLRSIVLEQLRSESDPQTFVEQFQPPEK